MIQLKRKVCFLLILMMAIFPWGGSAPSVDSRESQGDIEFVTESLNGYLLGYMSWGVKDMGLDSLQEKLEQYGQPLPEVKVAVIDSGINTSNRYLKGRYTDDGYNFLNNSADINDDQYHGTMVSGIIADGTSSNVKIMPLKVNDASGKGNMKNVEKAIYYAIEHHADVINLSISAEDPNRTLTILDKAIDDAEKEGIIVVAAAGNQQGDSAYRYPANKENVLTISSIDKNHRVAENANKGTTIDFALPGVMIFAPYKRIMFADSGTSLAAPHASAAAALLKTWDKSLHQEDVKEILKKYAVDLGEPGYDTTYGWGTISLSGFDPMTEPKPTQNPTVVPTEDLTEAPTQAPTDAPTEQQTEVQTTVQTNPPSEMPLLIGDVDRDGAVTIVDATCIQRQLASLACEVFDARAADVDADGKITILDATYIQRLLAGIVSAPIPC